MSSSSPITSQNPSPTTSSSTSPSVAASDPSATGEPNIVFVLTDDLAWNLVQYMPHVQAMQRVGTTLSNYYVVDSLCCPSRSAILTGEYPHNDGVFTNGGDDGGYQTFNSHGNQPNTFGVSLQKAGYRTGFMGNYLNGYLPKDPPPPGWNEWDVAGNGYPEFNYTLNENGKQVHYGKAPADYLTDVLSAKATSFIDSAAGKPFALEIATFAPHRPSTPAPRDANSFPGLQAPRTSAFNKSPTGAPSWLAAIPPLTATGEQEIDDQFRLRAQSVQAVDAMIGNLQEHLIAGGLAKNTYFVFSSDNGYHMGEHRLRPGKQTAYDTDIKLPLIVTGPGVPTRRTVAALTSSIDLAPTFETIGGASIPATTDGTSMLALWHGQNPPSNWQQAVLVEHHGPNTTPKDPDKPSRFGGNPPSYEAIRTASALYVQYGNGDREYYNTDTDPDELHNLAPTAAPTQLAPLQRALTTLAHCRGTVGCQSAAQLR